VCLCAPYQVSPSGGEDAANEYILEDDECPLSILMHHSPSQGESSVVCVAPASVSMAAAVAQRL